MADKTDPTTRQCPCCSRDNPLTGPHSATSYGVQCLACGLKMSIDLPATWEGDGDPGEWALREAISRWNTRPEDAEEDLRYRLIANKPSSDYSMGCHMASSTPTRRLPRDGSQQRF